MARCHQDTHRAAYRRRGLETGFVSYKDPLDTAMIQKAISTTMVLSVPCPNIIGLPTDLVALLVLVFHVFLLVSMLHWSLLWGHDPDQSIVVGTMCWAFFLPS